MNKSEPVRMVITTKSPVHIGSGAEYYPTDYAPFIKNGERPDSLYFYDRTALSEAIAGDESKFKEYCDLVKIRNFGDRGSMERFYEFIRPYVVKLPSSSFCRLSPEAAFKLGENRSGTPIAALIKNRYLKEPYIPGSAVKGMLKNIIYWKYYSDKKRKRLDDNDFPFGDCDPWRLVKVSDFQPVKASAVIDKLVNLHKPKKGSGSRTVSGIPNLSELIDAGSVFIGTVTFNRELYETALKGDDPFSQNVKKFFENNPLSAENIREAVKAYGDHLFKKEYSVFNFGGFFDCSKSVGDSNALKKGFEKWWASSSGEAGKKTARFIKLGKHAGAISKTVYGGDDFFIGERNVIIPQQKDKKIRNDTQTTVWLSSSGEPLGWAAVEIGISDEEWNRYLARRENFIKEPDKPPVVPAAVEQSPVKNEKEAVMDKYKHNIKRRR